MSARVKKAVRLRDIHWIYLIGEIIIVGGVMSFGIISYLSSNTRSAIVMLAMIPLMIAVYTIAAKLLLDGLADRIEKLIEAIHEVAQGNLDVELDLKGAQEYRMVYEEFNSMVRELKCTREEMKGFVNEFAHEFKTPITSISGFADYLVETSEGIENEERKEYLMMISAQSKRLCHLSQNALLLSKVEAMQFVDNRENYDVGEQLRECVIMLSQAAQDKGVDIALPEELTLYYNGNKEIMDQLWINLLSNAIKFTPRCGTVTVGGEYIKEENEIRVSIADTGVGMDENTRAHIFEKYYRNDSTSITKGSGIGLAIVARIIKLCNGRITVKSAPDAGSEFIVELPTSG